MIPLPSSASASLAGIDQAADTPNYVQGAKGYGERLGATYTDGFTDILIGGAVLPSLLHQDPRYFYQGTGTKKSRILHALSSPFICKGDNGRWQPNYSSVGGDLASGAISNAYYPASKSRRRVGVRQRSYHHGRPHGQRADTGIRPAQVHAQYQIKLEQLTISVLSILRMRSGLANP